MVGGLVIQYTVCDGISFCCDSDPAILMDYNPAAPHAIIYSWNHISWNTIRNLFVAVAHMPPCFYILWF
jgi:hypothetical protein